MIRSQLTRRVALATAVPIVAVLLSLGVASAVGDSSPDEFVPASSTLDDLSGNCDEAEHANDPDCAGLPSTTAPTTAVTTPTTGVTTPTTGVTTPTTGVTTPTTAGGSSSSGVDISGPCDEAEHANDPRCTGVGAADDNSGPGSGDNDDDDRDDDSSNSGSGSGSDDDDDSSNSGSGSGSDDDDDSSNSGSDDDDDDDGSNSGSGSDG